MSSDRMPARPSSRAAKPTVRAVLDHQLLAGQLQTVLHHLQVLPLHREARAQVVVDVPLPDAVYEQGQLPALRGHQGGVPAEQVLLLQRLLARLLDPGQQPLDRPPVGLSRPLELFRQRVERRAQQLPEQREPVFLRGPVVITIGAVFSCWAIEIPRVLDYKLRAGQGGQRAEGGVPEPEDAQLLGEHRLLGPLDRLALLQPQPA